MRNNAVALRRAAFFFGVGTCLVIAAVDRARPSAEYWLIMTVCTAPWLIVGIRHAYMGAWVHQASRTLKVITFFRTHRYGFDDVLDVRIDQKNRVNYAAVVRMDGGKVEVPLLERSAFFHDFFPTRDADLEQYIRRLRTLIGHWGVKQVK